MQVKIEKLNSVGINNESIFELVKYEDLKGEMRDEIKELENISPNLDVSSIAVEKSHTNPNNSQS